MSSTLDIDQSELVLTVPILLAIPALLSLFHFYLPHSLHEIFIFDHSRFSIYTLWTSAYVHRSSSHLTSNILGYTAAVLPLSLLYAHRGGLKHAVARLRTEYK